MNTGCLILILSVILMILGYMIAFGSHSAAGIIVGLLLVMVGGAFAWDNIKRIDK